MENTFILNLNEWIANQQKLLDMLKEIESKEDITQTDRLDLIIETRVAFQHIMRTIQAFDQWLQNPAVIRHMPREMLEDTRKTVWESLKALLELDIRHTSQFRDLIVELSNKGKLDPLVWTIEPGKKHSGLM